MSYNKKKFSSFLCDFLNDYKRQERGIYIFANLQFKSKERIV